MKTSTIKEVLEEKRKEVKKYLARFEKEQREMRKEKHLGLAGTSPEMLEGVAHQVGYMTGALSQLEELLDMFAISDAEYRRRREASEESLRILKAQMREVVRRAKKEDKRRRKE
jgi:hypothetical protein